MPMTIRDMMSGVEAGMKAAGASEKAKKDKTKRQQVGESRFNSLVKEKAMSKKININADRQGPDSVPTSLKKQEPTADIWKKGGAKSADEALGTDKSNVRKPVGNTK